MDLEKIGKFIINCRKKKNLTQNDLANKLYVTDRAVSRWERGKGMPDSSIMLQLCNELDISVNELLCGEYLNSEDYKKNSEENLFNITKKEQEYNKKLIICENLIGFMSAIIFITLILISAFAINELSLKIILISLAFVFLLIGICFAIKIETEVGYYECKHCKHKYIPKYINVFFAFHIGSSRFLKCPKCKKISYSKKIIK